MALTKDREGKDMKQLAGQIMIDFLPMKSFSANPFILTGGDGIHVTTIDGETYIDGLSGAFCVNLGYGNQALADAAAKQLGRLPLAFPTLNELQDREPQSFRF